MIRRLLVLVAILAALAALADRGLAAMAGSATARAVQRSENLSEKPDVSFNGFPFLTQALRGRFREVEVTVRDVRREGVTITRVDARLEDVRVGLVDALAGEVEAVPIGEGTAVATLSYADVNEFLATRPGNLRLSYRNGRLVVTGSVTVPGRGAVAAEGEGAVRVSGETLVVTVRNVRSTAGAALSAAISAAAGDRFSFTVPVRGLPFGIRLVSVAATGEGLVVSASARAIVVRVR